jgi:hypothetical protein
MEKTVLAEMRRMLHAKDCRQRTALIHTNERLRLIAVGTSQNDGHLLEGKNMLVL